MRSHPSCWNKTLAQLGFRRKRRKAPKHDQLRRRSLFEALEQRQMLSGDPLLDPAAEEPIQFVASGPEFQLLQPEMPIEDFLSLTEEERAEVETVFLIETVQTESGPKAIISFNPNSAVGPPAGLQRLQLELQHNGRVIDTYEILIDIAEESFREQFLADRIANIEVNSDVRTLSEATEATTRPLTTEELAQEVAFWDTFIGPKTLEQQQRFNAAMDGTLKVELERADLTTDDLVSIAKSDSLQRARVLGNAPQTNLERKRIYSEVEKQTEQLKQDRLSATTDVDREAITRQEQSLSNLTLALAKNLREDLSSTDATLAQSAQKVRDELVAISDPMDIMFAGLNVDNEVERATNIQGDEKALSFVETGRYVFDNQLEIDLGEHQAMVQVTRLGNLRLAAATSISESPAVEDGFFRESTPTAMNAGGDRLRAIGTANDNQESLIRFDLGQFAGLGDPTTIASAVLELTELGTGVGNAEVYAWNGLLDGGADSVTDWDETNLRWDRIHGTHDFESKLSEFTRLNDWVGGTTTEIDVTSQVQRALLFGDANGDGVFGAAGSDGDIEAFHLAVTNWDAYVAEYGPRANSASDLLARTDGGHGDGTIDTGDIADFFRRHGFSQGDYNLDGTVQDNEDSGLDGLDWATWHANYGLENARFTQGDGNFDGVIDNLDYNVWLSRKSEDNLTAEEPEIIVWVRPEDSTTNIKFASQEHATQDGPTLVVTEQPDLALNKFSVDGSNLVVDYAVLGDTFTDVKVQLYKVGSPDTLLHETAVQSGALGTHEVLIATSVLSSIVEGDSIYAKVVGTPASGTQSNLLNDQLDFEFSTDSTQRVNSLDDAGMDTLLRDKHTLRELIEADESLGWFDTLALDDSLFGQGQKTIVLGDHSGDLVADRLDIYNDLTISGPGQEHLAIDARDQTRGIVVQTGTVVALSGLTIMQGYTLGHGAGIYNKADLTIDGVTVADSNAQSHAGGIYNLSGSTLEIQRSTIDGNTASYGGGISGVFHAGQSLTVNLSTISNNTGSGHTGGLNIFGTAGGAETQALITSSTFSGNSSDTVGGALRAQTNTDLRIVNSTITRNDAVTNAGGIFSHTGATTTLHNTILADNSITGTAIWATDASGDIGGTVAEPSKGNLIGIGQSGHQMDNTINQVGTTTTPLAPMLSDLKSYGLHAASHVPLSGSPAIDRGDDTLTMSYGAELSQSGLSQWADLPAEGTAGVYSDVGSAAVYAGYETEVVTIGSQQVAAVTAAKASPGSIRVTRSLDLLKSNLVVIGNDEDPVISLREALVTSELPGDIEITFADSLTGRTLTLDRDSEELVISEGTKIIGLGVDQLTIDANASADDMRSVFRVDSGVTASIEGLTITGGNSRRGGGINNAGNLKLDHVKIEGNTADIGGGIYLADSGPVSLNLTNSMIDDNSARLGGGLYSAASSGSIDIDIVGSTFSRNRAESGSPASAEGGAMYLANAPTFELDVSNSTFSGNEAEYAGGGIHLTLAALPTGSDAVVAFTNVTVAENKLTGSGAGGGAGIHLYGFNSNPEGDPANLDSVELHNSIVARNTKNGGANHDDIFESGGVLAQTSSYNLIGDADTAGGLDDKFHEPAYHNIVGDDGGVGTTIDPGLSALGNYGGPTQTHELDSDSPARNAGDDAAATATTDQRGFNRDDGSGVDIGATEYHTAIWREAENYDENRLVNPAGTKLLEVQLEVIGDPSASGGRMVSIFPGQATNANSLDPAVADFFTEYTIDVQDAGDYTLWARLIVPDDSADSLKVLVDGTLVNDFDPDSIDNDDDWQWLDIGGAAIALNAGSNTVKVRHIDKSVQIDKLLVTSDSTFVPSGLEGDDPRFARRRMPVVELPATIRDFNAKQWTAPDGSEMLGHPDFQGQGRLDPEANLTQPTLSEDKKPALSSTLNGRITTPTGTLAEDEHMFNFWFNTDDRYNREITSQLMMVQDNFDSSLYHFAGSNTAGVTAKTHEFYPINGLLLSDAYTAAENYEAPPDTNITSPGDNDAIDRQYDSITDFHNAYFTLELHAEFTYRKNLGEMEQQFFELVKSDDDLWIFIDGHRWVDLGGVHQPYQDTFDLDLAVADPGNPIDLVEGETYSFDLFHAQRNKFDAHLSFQTNIELRKPQPDLVSLEETSEFVEEREFAIPLDAPAIDIHYENLDFDSGSGNPNDVNDAFEIAILDEQGRPARTFNVDGTPKLDTISGLNDPAVRSSDAIFNFTQGQQPVWASGVDLVVADVDDPTTGFVRVNLDGLRTDRTYQVVMRLINNDADDGTKVYHTANPVSIANAAPVGAPNYLTQTAQQNRYSSPDVSFSTLRDVTNSFDVSYQNTTIDALENAPELNELRTRVALTKLAGQQVRDDLLIAVKPPTVQSDPAGTPGYTELINYDGTLPYAIGDLPAGTPFIRITGLMDTTNGFYDNTTLPHVELAFLHEKIARFDFELVVLGELNDPPSFVSDPYGEYRGDAYPIEFQPVAGGPTIPMLEIVAARGAEFRYTPDTFDPNDDYTAISIEPVTILDPTPGDTTDAYSGMRVIDTNDDGRNDTVVWTPYEPLDLGVHTVNLRVTDEHGASTSANDQIVKIRVVADDFNRPPFFESPPKTIATFGETYEYDSYARDPDIHTLTYVDTVSMRAELGGRPQDYAISDLPNDTGLATGQDITHLTFINNGSGVSMFSNVRLYERDRAAEPERIRFDYDRFDEYGSAGNTGILQVTGDTSVIRIEGDGRFAYQLPTDYRLTEHTVLEFTFASDSNDTEGTSHGIGIEDDPTAIDSDNWFRVYGSSTTAGNSAPPEKYRPAWTEDQSANFKVDDDTGVVTWENIPAEAIGHWVHVDLYASETDSLDALAGNPLQAHQPYELFVEPNPGNSPPVIITPSLPDYALTRKDVPGSAIVDGEFNVVRNRPTDEQDLKTALFGTAAGISLVSDEDNFVITSRYEEQSDGSLMVSSIGTFSDGLPFNVDLMGMPDPLPPTYGLPSRGIVLSTGDVHNYGTNGVHGSDVGIDLPNRETTPASGLTEDEQLEVNFTPDLQSSNQSDAPQIYAMLESITSISESRDATFDIGPIRNGNISIDNYTDISTVTVKFEVEDPSFSRIAFDVVFGSEEWSDIEGRFVGSQFIDAFGIFLNPFADEDFDENSNVTAPIGYAPATNHPSFDLWDDVLADDPEPSGSGPRDPGDLIGAINDPLPLPLTSDHPQMNDIQGLPFTPDVSTHPDLDAVLWPYEVNGVPPATNANLNLQETPVMRFELDLVEQRNELVFVLADSFDEDYDTTVFISSISTVSTTPYSEVVEAIDPDEDDKITFSLERDYAFEAQNSGYTYVNADINNIRASISNEVGREGQFDWDTEGLTPGDYYVKVIADDGRGGTDEKIYTMTISETESGLNQKPEIRAVGELLPQDPVGPPETIVLQEGREAFIPTDVFDANDDRLRYELEALNGDIPEGADIRVDLDGNILWTSPVDVPASDPDGMITGLVLRAIDPGGKYDEFTFNIDVGPYDPDSNTPPEILSTAPASILQGEVYRYEAKAKDLDYDPITWSKAVGPGDFVVTEDGLVIWDTTKVDPDSYPISLEVSDGFESSFERYDLTVRERNVDPILEEIPIQYVDRNGTGSITSVDEVNKLVATDSNIGDLLTFEIIPISELPAGEFGPTIAPDLIDPNTTGTPNDVRVSWTPAPGIPDGVYYFEVAVTDGNGGRDSDLLSVVVHTPPMPNTAPQFLPTSLMLQPVVLGEEWTLNIYATDTEDGLSTAPERPEEYVVDIDEVAKSRGMVYDQGAGVLSWTPTNEETATVTLTATDSGGLPATFNLTLPVNVRTNLGGNEPSEIKSTPSNLSTILGGTAWTYIVKAEDIDAGDTATIRVESFTDEAGNDLREEGNNQQFTITSLATGQLSRTQISWIPNGNEVGLATLVVSADDGKNSVGAPSDPTHRDYTQSIPIAIRRNASPFILEAVKNQTIPLGESEVTFPFKVIDFDADNLRVELLSPGPSDASFMQGMVEITGPFLSSSDPANPTQFELKLSNIPSTVETAGSYPLRVRITDDFGNPVEHTIDFSIGQPDVLNATLEYRSVATVGEEYVAQVTRTDKTGVPVKYKLLVGGELETTIPTGGDGTRPVGLSINEDTGRISWLPGSEHLSMADDALYEFTAVMHEEGAPTNRRELGPVNFSVAETFSNTPPIIKSDPEGIPYSLTKPFVYELKGEDAENDPLTWVHVSGPGELVGNVLTWRPTEDDLNKSRFIVIRVDDPTGPGESQTIQLRLDSTTTTGTTPAGPGNTPPRITSTPTRPGDALEDYVYVVRGTDDDGHEFTLLPPAQTNPTNSQYTWTDNQDGSFTFTWHDPPASSTQTFDFGIIDEKGLRGQTQSFTISYDTTIGSNPTVDIPISIDEVPPQAVALGSTYSHTLKWTDPDIGGGDFPILSVSATYVDGGDSAQAMDFATSGFDPSTGVFDWRPTAQDAVGVMLVTVTAKQRIGDEPAQLTYSLEVFDPELDPNLRPVLDAAVPLYTTPGARFSFNVPGTDDGPFDFYLLNDANELVSSHGVFSITPEGTVTWDVPEDQNIPSTETFRVDLRDDADQRAVSWVDYTVNVREDQDPTVAVIASPRRQEAGQSVLFTILADDDIGIVDELTTFTVQVGSGMPEAQTIRPDNTVLFKIPDGTTDGTITATATVLDTALQSATSDATVTVRPVNENAPQVGITSQKFVLIEESFKLRGYIYDDDSNLIYYAIRAIPDDGGAPIVLKERNVNDPSTFENFLSETHDIGGRRYITNRGNPNTATFLDLYTLSPFALPNGTYEIEVVAIDDAEEGDRDTAIHGIQSTQKLGNFALSVTDMTVPVAGFPITVVRNYNSHDSDTRGTSESPGFGYGWSLDLVRGKFDYLSAAVVVDRYVDDSPFTTAGLTDINPMVAGSVLTFSLPGGEEHEFVVQPVSIEGNPVQIGLGFEPTSGNGSVLEFVGRQNPNAAPSAALYPLEYPGEWWTRIPDAQRFRGFQGAIANVDRYDSAFEQRNQGEFLTNTGFPINADSLKANYRLTTRNGTQYTFDSKTRDLLEVYDPFNDTTITFKKNRYTAKNSKDETIGELIIEEKNGLITSISNEKGDRVEYRYDENDLLRYVFDQRATALVDTIPPYDQITFDSTPRPTTSFFYGETDFGEINDVPERFLTSIRGIASSQESDRTLTIGWDADGRVHKIGDASDAEATFTYDEALGNFGASLGGWSSETIADAYGVPSEVVRDETGNVRRQLKRVSDDGNGVWQVTAFEYDSEDRQIGVSRTFQVAESGPSTGDRYTSFPAGADEMTFIADPDDPIFDYTFWDSVEKYDDSGNLVVQVDSAGNRTTYSDYDDRFGFAGKVVAPTGTTITTNVRADGNFDEQRFQTTVRENTKGPNSVTVMYLDGGRVENVFEVNPDTGEGFNQAILNYDESTLLVSSSIDASGQYTYYAYDRADNQVLSYYHWIDPAEANVDIDKTVVTHTVYDEKNRVTRTEQYAFDGEEDFISKQELEDFVTTGGHSPLWTTSTDYNLADQTVKSTDRFGTDTYTLYDSRGNVVETRTETSDPNTSGTGSVWIVTRIGYDKNGRQVATTDPFVVRNLYDPHHADFFDPAMNGMDEVLDPATGSAWGVNARYHINHTLYDDIGRVKETRRVEFSDDPLPLAMIYNASGGDSVFDTDFRIDEDLLDDANLVNDYTIPATILSNSITTYDEEGRVYLTESNTATPDNTDNLRTYSKYDVAGRLTHSAIAHDVDRDGTIDVNLIAELLDFNNPGSEAFVTETRYDAAGRQEISVDANNVQTKYEYDDLGNVLSTTFDHTDPDQITTRTLYDYAGRRTHTTDALGQTTVYGFDEATGRLTSVTLPAITDDSTGSILGSPEYIYQYDNYGNQTKIIDPNLNETSFTYNHLRQRTQRILDDGLTETMLYNDDGQVVRSIDFEGRTVDYLYDEFGRVDKKHYYLNEPVGIAPGMGDDTTADGGPVDNIDEIVDYAYDALGRLVDTIQDFDGDLSSDSNERTTNNTYDEQGRLTRVTTNEGTINYAYDNLGRMTNTWTEEVAVDSTLTTTQTDYTYDALGRLATVTAVRLADAAVSAGDATTTYKYDAVGNLQYVLSPKHASYYEYDNLNQLEELTQFRDDNTSGDYDAGDDRLATFVYSRRYDGKKSQSVETFYDTDGMTSVQVNTFTWLYDEAGRLVEEQLVSTGTSELTDYTGTYGYDLTGNRTWHDHDSASSDPNDSKKVEYRYDGNDRLLWEKIDLGRNTSVDNTIVYEYDPPPSSPLSKGSRQTRKATFSGDNEAGTGIPEAGTDTRFVYDARGRLSQHEVIGGDTIDYRYNDNGIRISRTTSGPGGSTDERFLIDENNHTGYAQVLEERTAAAAAVRAYLLGHDVIAQRDAGGAAILHLLYDGHGSTRALVDATGQRLSGHIYAYDAYGVRLDNFTAPDSLNLFYSGEWRDSAGFDYLRARPYDFANGRFLRMDDYAGSNQDPQSLHKYLYTHADPINGIDPSGLLQLAELGTVQAIQNVLQAGINVVGTAAGIYFKVQSIIDLYFALDSLLAFVSGGALADIIRSLKAGGGSTIKFTAAQLVTSITDNTPRILSNAAHWAAEALTQSLNYEVESLYIQFPIPGTSAAIRPSVQLTRLKISKFDLPLKVRFGNPSNSIGTSIFGFGIETSRRTKKGKTLNEFRGLFRVDPGKLAPSHPNSKEWDAWEDLPFHYHATKLFP